MNEQLTKSKIKFKAIGISNELVYNTRCSGLFAYNWEQPES